MTSRSEHLSAHVTAPTEDRTLHVIDALTGIRAVMCLWVVADHLREPIIRLIPAAEALRPFLSAGFIGLETFFILSGFIISHNYAERLALLDRGSYAAFIWARVARIFPVHLFALGAMAATIGYAALQGRTLSANQDYSVWTFLGNVFLLQAIPGVDPWNWPSWSVSSEFAAYLLFPLAAAAVFRAQRRTALAIGALVVTAQAVVLGLLMSTSWQLVGLMWVRIAGEFTLGCLLWAAWRRGVRAGRRWDLLAAASLLAATAIVIALAGTLFVYMIAPLLGAFVISVASADGPVSHFLGSRVVEYGGRISYSVYLMHSPVLAAIWLLYPVGPWMAQPLAVQIAVVGAWFLAVIIVGAVVYHLVEEPSRGAIRRWVRARRNRQAKRRDAVQASTDRSTGLSLTD